MGGVRIIVSCHTKHGRPPGWDGWEAYAEAVHDVDRADDAVALEREEGIVGLGERCGLEAVANQRGRMRACGRANGRGTRT